MTARVLSSWNTIHTHCRLRKLNLSRYLSAKPAADNNTYSNTLLLPKTSFPLRSNPKETDNTYRDLSCDSLYRWQWENAKGPLFVLHDGPPYANGDLHMGHALNKIIKDIINRFHLSQGRKVHYVPGWDCHGLPIENKAMKEMKRSPLNTPASVIRNAAKETALREIDSQRNQFRPLAVMADWDSQERTYRTLDRHYEIRQLRIFQKMVEKGASLAEAELEYKDDHVSHSVYVTFDLAEPNDVLRKLVSNRPKVQFLVWTTTPWTLTANMGIAVHDELVYEVVVREDGGVLIVARDRLDALSSFLGEVQVIGSITGKDLVGVSYHPIFSSASSPAQPLKIIHAPHVTALSGTGLVHCAPAHGAEDYDAFRLQNLLQTSGPTGSNVLCHVNSRGQFTSEVVDVVGPEHAPKLVGQEVLGDGNKAMVILLKELDKVLKIQRIKHRYPYDWKTNEPIIVTATSQWFANLDHIKADALGALKDVSFFPELSRKRLEAFVRSRSEWCISRQRVWGVPIPALHHIASGRVVLDSPTLEYIINALETKDVDWWESPIEEFVPPWLLEDGKSAAETWERGRDTMDVWFDSGTSWSMLEEMGVGRDRAGSRTAGNGRQFDADVCLEGSDQHRGWFQSQLLTAIGSRSSEDKAVSPYAALITHGMVLDEKGKKMSKSLGNIVSPMTIVNGSQDGKQPAYGVDVLRLWAATVDFWRDMSIGPTVISQAAESLRKLRNSARFCLGNLDTDSLDRLGRVPKAEMNILDRYVMHELYTLEQTALEGYKSYNFPKVISALNNFANITLSSLYFDITKDCLYANTIESHERRAVCTVLEQILGTMTKVLAPVLPYLAEEIHATWKADQKSVFMTPWTPLGMEWKDEQAAADVSQLLGVRTTVLSLLEKARRAKYLRSSLEAEVKIVYPGGHHNETLVQLLKREEDLLKTLLIVSDASVSDKADFSTEDLEWSYANTTDIKNA
ncbi:Isoleucine--tRNA ligase, mitochondrial [Psilocybe cubensis]|uniref:Isoleucine--tRNA ligase, mitochondrial n=1 Tax=Psilocybe cubensis TaxID=181762 RepID=A0ACB8GRG6_PSICU|nr:Isoleucine--tRNA ligase, mitochondrial [Psilocybe cubensis]KAH9477821.1 Isoleucine--tRNA ligase, mitochondrial [Psilocybe cubensis]